MTFSRSNRRVTSALLLTLTLGGCQSTTVKITEEAPELVLELPAGNAEIASATTSSRYFRTRKRTSTHPEALLENAKTLPYKGWMAIHFIDVGQGDAALLEFPCGIAMVDLGGEDSDNARLTHYLEAFFEVRPALDNTFDVVYLSHSHLDHMRGVSLLKESYNVRAMVDSGVYLEGGADLQQEFRNWVKQKKGSTKAVSTHKIEYTDGLSDASIDRISNCAGHQADPVFTAVTGGWSTQKGAFRSPNNHSLILRLDFGPTSFLFTGDLEDEKGRGGIPEALYYYQEDLSIFDVDIWKVGHHGSSNGISEDLEKAMTPKVALIGVGNPEESAGAYGYGHPSDISINMLVDDLLGVKCRRQRKIVQTFSGKGAVPSTRSLDHAVFATGWDGDILMLIGPNGEMEVRIAGSNQNQLTTCS